MPKVRKKLLILFFILLIVVFIETIYLLTSNKPAKVLPQKGQSQVQSSPQVLRDAPGIREGAIRYLQVLPKGILIYSTVTNLYQGEISELETKEGKLASDFTYSLKLTIKGPNSSTPFYFNKNNLKKLKGAPISSLKVGDQIRLQETIDLREDFSDNRKEIIITKIK